MMESSGNYWMFWASYLAAGAVFYGIFWRITRFAQAAWLSYTLRAVAAALILTPWQTNSPEATLAPALMIVTLDSITSGTDAATRALIPLILAVILALLVAGILLIINKRRKKNKRNNNDI